MRQYEGYEIGPILREIRKDKRLTVEDVADTAGISVSTLSQLEQGGRNLSMRNLYVLMDVYETDANTLLNLEVASDSIDAKLKRLPVEQRQFLMKDGNGGAGKWTTELRRLITKDSFVTRKVRRCIQ